MAVGEIGSSGVHPVADRSTDVAAVGVVCDVG